MQFTTLEEVTAAANAGFKLTSDKKRVYPIKFKKELCKFIQKSNMSVTAVANATGIKDATLYNWVVQYKQGLYNMNGAYAVSTTSVRSNQRILDALVAQKLEIDKKIKLIEECEKLGMTVTI